MDHSAFVEPEAATELADAVRRLARGSALVIGDVMLDRYIYGDVERVSREAPVPILNVQRELSVPGGAGNVVRNLVALGAAVAFVSVVGDDQAGSDLTGLIGGQPGVEPWLLVQGSRVTTQKTRFVAQGQQLLRTDREETGPIHPKLVERMLRIAIDAMAATSVTVLSDYCKGVLDGDVPGKLIAAAKLANRRVLVDLRGTDFARYAGADVIMPSRDGLARATGLPVKTNAAVAVAAERLRHEHGFGAVVVTRAEDGMTLVSDEGTWHYRAEAAEVFDVSGAGDTAVATLAAGLAAGLDLSVAARLANIAAGVVVGKVGIAVARESDLLAAITPQGGALRKIVTRETAAERVERWRRTGLRTGFMRGVFADAAEAAMLLEQARAVCDRLVVGVDGAPTVTANEPAPARAARLAGLPGVDLVVIDADENPMELLQALRPDMLVEATRPLRGASAGADLLGSWGGRVISLQPDTGD